MTQRTPTSRRQSMFGARVLLLLAAAVVLFVGLAGTARAQWTTPDANNNINNTNSGNVGIGTTNPVTQLHVANQTAASPRGITNSQHTGDSNAALFTFRKSRGTLTSPAAAVNGDFIGNLYGEAYDGAAYISGGRIRLGVDGTVSSGNVPTSVQFLTGTSGSGTERMRISSAGNVGIGTTAPDSLFTVNANTSGLQAPGTLFPGTILHVSGADSSKTRLLFDAFGSGFLPQLTYRYARGTAAAPSAVQAGDGLGQITASGYKTTGYTNGSRGTFSFLATENWTDAANGTAIAFNTTANGDSTPYERLRIDHSGSVGIGTTSPTTTLDVAGQIRSSSGGFKFPDGTVQVTAAGAGGGSITGVTAGSGLTGGGTSGNVTLTNSDGGSAQPIFKNIANAAGTTQFSAGSNADVLRFEGTGGTSVSFSAATKKITISGAGSAGWTDGGANVNLTNLSANVGVGTSSPAAKLHIAGANGPTDNTAAPAPDALQVFGGVGGNGSWGASPGGVGGAIKFSGGTGGTPVAGSSSALGGKGGSISLTGGTGGPNVFAVGGGAGGDVSINGGAGVANIAGNVILANLRGNVGIGTTSPGYSLDVNGGTNSLRAKAASSSANDTIATFESASGIQAIVRANGNVGIGTTSPAVKLDVSGQLHVAGVCGTSVPNSQGGYVSWNQMACGAGEMDFINHQGGGAGGFWFANSSTAGSTLTSLMFIKGDGNVGIGTNAPTAKLDVVGNLNASGTITGGNIVAKYQDVAEWVESSQALAAGTVVVLDHTKSNQVVSSSESYDTRVAGVISAQPGITLGEQGESKVLVATTGRVKVRVDASAGSIHIGDLLVTSDVAGMAMKSEPLVIGGRRMHAPGTLIGKALEPLDKGTGEILVLLSLQ